ncbi:MAG: GHKL domain-containing protein, partial [Symploca sp. SIO1A3]|nr:GHKL domain-containing protein [Symploca sp. SIO1A3]
SRLGRTELALQPTDAEKLIKDIENVVNINQADEEIEIRIPRPLPLIACDPILAAQVFNNLIQNAIKYNNSPQKWVEIGWLDLQTNEAEENFAFYVKDNGIGIREKHLDVIFRIFKRLHGQSKYAGGTGAGLTIVKKIVERHGGKIWVESIYGEGTTFYFTLK